MKLSEDLLEEYRKKILGFAYEKTGNSYEPEVAWCFSSFFGRAFGV